MPSMDRIKARLTEPPFLAPPAAPLLPPVQRGQPVSHRSFSQNGALVQRHAPRYLRVNDHLPCHPQIILKGTEVMEGTRRCEGHPEARHAQRRLHEPRSVLRCCNNKSRAHVVSRRASSNQPYPARPAEEWRDVAYVSAPEDRLDESSASTSCPWPPEIQYDRRSPA